MVEEHKKHFRGVWMRPEVLEMVEEDIINCKEAILLMMIDSLVEHGGRDCFASNRYLGQRLHAKQSQIKDMIKHLKEIGLLKQTDFDGRSRYLATAWNEFDGRQTAGKPAGRQPENRLADSRKKDVRQPEKGRQTAGKPAGRQPENRLSIYKEDSTKYIKTISQHPEAAGKACASEPKKPGGKSHPRWLKYATELYDAINSVRSISKGIRLSTWAEALSKLHSVDGYEVQRIRDALKQYCQYVRKGDLIRDNSKYLPVAYSGAAFREKFLRIEDAFERAANSRREDEDQSPMKIVVINQTEEEARNEANQGGQWD